MFKDKENCKSKDLLKKETFRVERYCSFKWTVVMEENMHKVVCLSF